MACTSVTVWRARTATCAVMPAEATARSIFGPVAGGPSIRPDACRPGDGPGGALDLPGQGLVASAVYVNPAKFAGNTRGGGQFGYPMLWVVRDTNLMMMVVQ
jgi:hypothetical protein